MIQHHHLSLLDWALVVIGYGAAVLFLALVPGARRVQRPTEYRGIGLVYAYLMMSLSAVLISTGAIINDWLILGGVLLIVLGLAIPNAVLRRRSPNESFRHSDPPESNL